MVLEKGGGDNSRVLWGSPPGLRATPWSRCPWATTLAGALQGGSMAPHAHFNGLAHL